MCPQWSLRSAWASAQSDQSLRCPHEEALGPCLSLKRTAKTLIRLDGCPGWSESSLGVHVMLLVLSCTGSNGEVIQIRPSPGWTSPTLFLRNELSFIYIHWLSCEKLSFGLHMFNHLIQPAFFKVYPKMYWHMHDVSSSITKTRYTYEPPRDKTNKVSVRPAKTRPSLIRVFAVRSMAS